jgi:uncharacterized membrane protein
MTRAAWWTMAGLSAAVAVYAVAVLAVPGFGPPFVSRIRADAPWKLWLHLGASPIALAAGALQLNGWLRARALTVHRWLGRVYVLAVLAGGFGGLTLAPASQGGMVTRAGFGVLAVCWIGCTLRGYLAIRFGDDRVHRAWMIRSFALTFAAVTLRIILPIELALGVPFPAAYAVVSWACWVPNLFAAEWFVRRA